MKIKALLVLMALTLSLAPMASAAEQSRFGSVTILGTNSDALLAKRSVIAGAQQSIKLVYFIIDNDPTSAQLMLDLMDKANKGVKVQILVDAFMSFPQENTLLLLSQNPNIEIKRFRAASAEWLAALKAEGIDAGTFIKGVATQNKDLILASIAQSPLAAKIIPVIKQAQAGQLSPEILKTLMSLSGESAPLAAGFNEFLYRTHHKLLLVDNQWFVTGGRNWSDEYHANQGDPLLEKRSYPFKDQDVLAQELEGRTAQGAFDRLWASRYSVALKDTIYPVLGTTTQPQTLADLQATAARAAHVFKDFEPMKFSADAVRLPDVVKGSIVENLILESGRSPEITTEVYVKNLLNAKPGDSVDLVSAYFYIDSNFKTGQLNRLYRAIVAAAKRGVNVSIYTNSVATTDLNMVNMAAFPTYRELITAGVRIRELNPGQGSLHAKTVAFGNNVVFIGSYNLDPRSELRDTNIGLLIEDPSGKAAAAFRASKTAGLQWTDANPDNCDLLLQKSPNGRLFQAPFIRELM